MILLESNIFQSRIIVTKCQCVDPRPIPVAEWSKVRVCSRSPAGIAGSNPAGGMDVCLL